MLSRGGLIVELGQTNINNNYWNVTLLGDPIFHPDYISFILDGSFYSGQNIVGKKDSIEEPSLFTKMPVYVGDPKAPVKMQFFVSEMAVNKAILTMFENGALHKTVRVPSSYIRTLIPNFNEVFGNEKDVFIIGEALSSPKFEIRTNRTVNSFEVGIRILNPFNESFEAASIKLKVVTDFAFELL